MNYLVIYSGYQRWSHHNIEKGTTFSTIEELEQWLGTLTTYCNEGYPHLKLNNNSRKRVEDWLRAPTASMYFQTTGCGSWEINLRTTECNSYEQYRRQLDEAYAKEEHDRVQRILDRLNQQRKGWYHVKIELTGDGICEHGYKDFSGEVIANSGADAYEKAVNECRNLAPGFEPADMTSIGYEYTFLGVKTDDGYSVELWNEWKSSGKI